MHTLHVADFFVSPETAPDWWTAQRGAWGCLMAHRGAIQHAMDNKLRDVLILEGDAEGTGRGFDPEFIYRTWLARTPQLDLFYLGGQFLDVLANRPQIAGVIPLEGKLLAVLRGGSIERAHAYCLSWSGARKIAAAIDRAMEQRRCLHYDGLLREMQAGGELKYFAVAPWLYKQAAHRSAVRDEWSEENEWPLSDAEWRIIAESIGQPPRGEI